MADTKNLLALPHPDYTLMQGEVEKVRDCIEGAFAVKRKTFTYLPHPSQIDQTSKEQQVRYLEYLYGAEFDGAPDDLRRSLLGKMRISSTTIELPERVQYLEQNADGDGLSLAASIEFAANNILSMKWHILVVDYTGAPKPGERVSVVAASSLNARANIKQYTREDVVNWSFARVNGVMQLRWIKLLEMQDDFNPQTGSHQEVQRYLVLGLDDDGNYYQQVIYQRTDGEETREDATYVSVNGAPLKWLPVVIVADEELPNNAFPRALGYLNQVCDASLHNYRVSAKYKEVQRTFGVTLNMQGARAGDDKLFAELNNGRTYLVTGGTNILPEGWNPDMMSADSNMEDFHWYFQRHDSYIASIGGRNAEKAGAMTATEANILAGDQNALLETLAENLEQGFKRAVSYCAMFEGLWSPDDVESRLDDIGIALPRDFATPKLTPQERQQIVNEYNAALISHDEALRQLYEGGATSSDIDTIKSELESQPPRVSVTAAVPQPTEGSTQ